MGGVARYGVCGVLWMTRLSHFPQTFFRELKTNFKRCASRETFRVRASFRAQREVTMTPPNSSDEESDGANSFVVASQMRPNDYSHVPDWLQLTQSTNPDDQMEDIKWVRVIENGSSKKVKQRNGKLFFKFYAKCTICANDPFECNSTPGRGEWLEPRSWFRSRVLEQHETSTSHKKALERLSMKRQAQTNGGIEVALKKSEEVMHARDPEFEEAKRQQTILQLGSTVRTVMKMAYSDWKHSIAHFKIC